MLTNWIARWFKPKGKVSAQTLQTPAVVLVPPQNPVHQSLFNFNQEVDMGAVVNDPVYSLLVLTLYCTSVDDLLKEVVRPSQHRQLAGVTVGHFFKDSKLPPAQLMQRLQKLCQTPPKSNFAIHDIERLTQEVADFVRAVTHK